MLRNCLNVSVAAALLAGSFSPAVAQSRYSSQIQPPVGATAALNFRVPLGAAPYAKERKATYGLTLGFGRQTDSTLADGRLAVREAKVADIRFTGDFKLQHANVMTFDLANLKDDPRLNMGEGKGKETTWLWIGGAVVAGVLICWAAGCFDDDDHDHDSISSPAD